MSNEKAAIPTKVVTDEVRFSYLNAFVPRKAPGSDKEKYSVCLLVPKSNKALKKRLDMAVEAAKAAGKDSKWGGKFPPNLKMPIRDGDLEKPDDENYAGHWFVNCTSDQKPGVVDANLNPIISATEIYSGCYGKASINFFPFAQSGNKGVACGLQNLMKTNDGPALAGRASAEADFGGEDNADL